MMPHEITELHQIARHYDGQIWATPAALIALSYFEFQDLHYPFVDPQNMFILLTASCFSWLLLLVFNKTHLQQLRLSFKLRQANDRLATFYSPHIDEIKDDVDNMHEAKDRVKISFLQKFLAERSVSTFARNFMLYFALANSLAFLIVLIQLPFFIEIKSFLLFHIYQMLQTYSS